MASDLRTGKRLLAFCSEHSTPEIVSLYLRLNHATPALCRTALSFVPVLTPSTYSTWRGVGYIGTTHAADSIVMPCMSDMAESKRKIIYWLPQRNAVLRVHGSIIYFFLLPSFSQFLYILYKIFEALSRNFFSFV